MSNEVFEHSCSRSTTKPGVASSMGVAVFLSDGITGGLTMKGQSTIMPLSARPGIDPANSLFRRWAYAQHQWTPVSPT